MRNRRIDRIGWFHSALAVGVLLGCGDGPTFVGGGGGAPAPQNFRLDCDLPTDFLFDGGVSRNGIPALFNPDFVEPTHADAAYLIDYAAVLQSTPFFPEIRVVGLEIDGQPVAIPFNILWWHEIVNIDVESNRLAITLCPLTGSALAFDLGQAGIDRLQVSGLVYQNNLMMFDVETESLWPQLSRGARCGSRSGEGLQVVPLVEMRWDRWLELHPTTLVVSSVTGAERNYAAYPYDLYEASDDFLTFPIDGALLDRTRPLKERVLGVPIGAGGTSFPFNELSQLGQTGVVSDVVGGQAIEVIWDASANTAWAFEAATGRTLVKDGDRIIDEETGSIWTVDGIAVSGPRLGERLVPVPSYVVFWFAWTVFQPDGDVWLFGG